MLFLRVDVDRRYLICKQGMIPSLSMRTFYYPINFLTSIIVHPRVKLRGYLTHLSDFVEYLNDKGIKATFFLKTNTIPGDQGMLNGHRVGIHSWIARTLTDFEREFGFVQRAMGNFKVDGMSKHGSGPRTESWKDVSPWTESWNQAREYEPRKYLEWCRAMGLRYFAGNSQDARIPCQEIGKVTFYPSAFWLGRNERPPGVDIPWLLREGEKRDVIVLVHPENWLLNVSERDDLELILSKGPFGLI